MKNTKFSLEFPSFNVLTKDNITKKKTYILKNINSQNQQQENSLSQVIYLMSQIYWFFIYYIYFDVVTSKDAFPIVYLTTESY